MERQDIKDYFFEIVELAGNRATCNRGKSGALLVKDNRIVSVGYVGAPKNAPHCGEMGHEFIKKYSVPIKASWSDHTKHCIRTVHAEMNAIIHCARFGISTDSAILYCTMFPCYDCAKVIVNAGIREVHCINEYQASDKSRSLFDLSDIHYTIKNQEVMQYDEGN